MPTKQVPHYRTVNGSTGDWYYSESISYSVSKKINGSYRAYLPCDHKKLIKPGGYYKYSGGYVSNWAHPELIPWDSFVSYGLSQAHLALDFQENNNFELIPFLLDWDATLAMFAKKFIRELSYGAVTWGVMPFLSDLKSLVSSLQDIQDGILKSYEKIIGKRISRRFTWSTRTENTYPGHIYQVNGHTTVFGVVQGDITYPDSPERALAAFLDEIGLNPDLKTAWDVIPFSFLVDYFLPIGDFLESLSPRGWFNPSFTVSGGYSVKYTLENSIHPQNFAGTKSSDVCTWTHYVRSPGALKLQSRPSVEPKFESPSYKELFNTLYLSTNLKNVF